MYATPNVTEEFAELILKLLEDEKRRLQMGSSGLARGWLEPSLGNIRVQTTFGVSMSPCLLTHA